MRGDGFRLCPTERDRERLLDMSARAGRARQVGSASTGLVLLAAVPWFGFVPLLLGVASTFNVLGAERLMARTRTPERVAAASVLLTQLILGTGVVVTGGPTSPVLMWMAIPTVSAAIRFRRRVVTCFIGTGIAIGLAACLTDPAQLLAEPIYPIASLALLISVVTPAMVLLGAEIQHREDAVVDPLTGLLNRKALGTRFKELEQQARQSEASVCVIAADLDHFKGVNDVHGHARGDDVLREVTHEMRKRLRTFELMYRTGGEEFVVVLPGVDLPEGVAVAERLRQAVEALEPAGLHVTISMGVSAASGAEVSADELLAAADRALYAAKDSGRNAVRADGHDDLAPMLEAVGIMIA